MKEFDVKEFNRLCAELLGYVNTTPTDKDFNIHEHPETKKMIETNFTNVFTEDWNWIMQVVEKIESLIVAGVEESRNLELEEVEWSFTFEINGKQCMINRDCSPQFWGTSSDFLKLYSCENKSKKESVVKAIWQFLNWYEKNK